MPFQVNDIKQKINAQTTVLEISFGYCMTELA